VPTKISINQLQSMAKQEAVWCMVQIYNVEPEMPSSDQIIPYQIQKLVDKF